MTTRRICALAFVGMAAMFAPPSAEALLVSTTVPPNYVFPDGVIGFALRTSGGPVNPGVIVGFNPQPEPPGVPAPFLDLANKLNPSITQTCDGSVIPACDGSVFKFEMSFLGLPGVDAGLLLPAVQKPKSDGVTGFRFVLGDGSVLIADLGFSGAPLSWVALNPQPLPPGAFIAYQIGFATDASVGFSVSINGDQLSFAPVPELSTWMMMTFGFAMFGGLAWRRAKNTPPRAVPA